MSVVVILDTERVEYETFLACTEVVISYTEINSIFNFNASRKCSLALAKKNNVRNFTLLG